jgi:hypothetical protein
MLWGLNDPEAEGNRRSSTTLRSHPATALYGSVALSFVIPSSRLAEASRERNDRPPVRAIEARVPHISLVFREMWDTTVLDAQLYRCH